MNIAADRILGIVLLGLAAFVAAQAMQLHVPFSYDPLGPKAFPLGLSVLLAVFSLVLLFRPGTNGDWPRGVLVLKLLGVLLTLLVYALVFTSLGYLPATALVVLVLSRLFGAPWAKAAISGVLVALGSYLLFTQAMGILLPASDWLTALT
ncbi:putative tricarboxylic transport membrane protein [Modicisalibacter muralis]|uniref:Putative tricarboxylic transport membrane protein n=1 Tax=Modicisalibacter muralis TaxID=119000 RepID=A0A1G9IHJ7_9GAMM|nr:tripartite tricarboxylate transporter TctB family protein [Halomonas muralis]SDL24680.1 putative tricarboxylic transport membrane protein [Halomonas muralis]